MSDRAIADHCVESLMPKGVEHIGVFAPITVAMSVESLMPKGVEHMSRDFSFTDAAMCRISDAERR